MGSQFFNEQLQAMNFLNIIAIVVAFFIANASGACQIPGDSKCFSAFTPIGPVGDACCTGSSCRPYLQEGETLTNPVDWYCQWTDPIPVNGLCGNKQGLCDSSAGLTCVDGKCTAAPATTTTSTSTTTTAEVCEKKAGELCLDNKYGLSYKCCSPYTCTKETEQSSICKVENLALGETCFGSTGSLGTCADPNICLNNVCTAKSTTFIQPVKGLCYSSDIGQTVGTCCDGSFCAPGTGSSDFFCQAVLEEGQDCNPEEFRGFCRLAPTVWIMYAQQEIKPPPLQPLLPAPLQPLQHQQLLASRRMISALTSMVVEVLAVLESLPA